MRISSKYDASISNINTILFRIRKSTDFEADTKVIILGKVTVDVHYNTAEFICITTIRRR